MNRFQTLCLVLAFFSGCAQEPRLPPPLDLPPRVVAEMSRDGLVDAMKGDVTPKKFAPTPALPPPERSATGKPPPAKAEAKDPPDEKADLGLAFEQIPLPTLIQVVYGTILKKNFNVDPQVAARKDLVTIRTGGPQTPTQIAELVRTLLKSYGIAVLEIGNLLRIVPDGSALGYLPEIRRGRALPETPQPLRPIFQLVELNALKPSDVAPWIRQMFGNKIDIKDDVQRNAVLLSGKTDDVAAVMEAIQVLDQPLMRGRHGLRINPSFWTADDLAKRLVEILQAEGITAVTNPSQAAPVILLPIPAINALVVFTSSESLLKHITDWVGNLDRASDQSSGRNIFSYAVQYTDADALAKTMQQLLGDIGVAPATPAATPAAGAAATATRPAPIARKVVVDRASNTLIFIGTAEDYGQIRTLLQSLDKPAREALIEVTVAEVTLKDNLQFGIEWLLKEARLDGTAIVQGTLGGLSIGSSGFNYSRIDGSGNKTLLLNALASNNQATILSSPRVVARSGETATIQVGQEVPILTSQQTSAATGGTGSILQTVQYRNTGVILSVKPVIHSGDQIDLDVSQEVSSAQATATGVNTSPTFSSRRLQTKLSLKNGSTVLLGGLISNSRSGGNAGIPLLKDIPILGHAFRTDTDVADRTELIVLITPYVISDDADAQAVTDAFRRQLGTWAHPAAGQRVGPAGAQPMPARPGPESQGEGR